MSKILSDNRNKKGLSAVVTTVLLIALTIAMVSVVWVIINNVVKGKLGSAESCFGIIEKVTLNPRYTCYDQTSGNDEILISISVGDLENLDDILVSVSGQGTSSSFKIKDDPAELLSYPSRAQQVSFPGKNSGLTYIYILPSSFTQEPDSVEIAPIIDGEQCGISSSINEFDSCSSLA